MANPKAVVIDAFHGGDAFYGGERLLLRMIEPGTVVENTRNGAVHLAFGVGAIALAAPDGSTIAGPIDFEAAIGLARQVLDGDSQAMTHPLTPIIMAAALIGFSTPPEPEAPAQAVASKEPTSAQ